MKMELPQAVEYAVDYCIQNGILANFLSKNRADAIAMSIFEYDEEKHIRSEKELSYNEGRISGIKEGEERLNQLYIKLATDNRMDDLRKSMADKDHRQKLYAEYNL